MQLKTEYIDAWTLYIISSKDSKIEFLNLFLSICSCYESRLFLLSWYGNLLGFLRWLTNYLNLRDNGWSVITQFLIVFNHYTV